MSLLDRESDREQMQYGLGLLDGLTRAKQMIEDGADSPFDDTKELLYLLDRALDGVVQQYKPYVAACGRAGTE